MTWLDANADGLALLFWVGVIFCAWLSIAAVIEQLVIHRRRRHQLHVDFRRCERVGSQDEFARRLHSRTGR